MDPPDQGVREDDVVVGVAAPDPLEAELRQLE
jgi:hypothetical protein